MEYKCPQCGAPIDPGTSECKYCGEKLAIQKINNEVQGTDKGKDKMVAGLLALFLGALGIHKFYLGYKKEAQTTVTQHYRYLHLVLPTALRAFLNNW